MVNDLKTPNIKENLLMSEFWIPIILFLCIFGIVAVVLYFNSRHEESRQATIRAAIERGQELTEDVVKSLTPARTPKWGLAIGLPIVGLALGLLIVGLGIGEPEAAWASAFPFFFGMGFIVFWYLEQRKS